MAGKREARDRVVERGKRFTPKRIRSFGSTCGSEQVLDQQRTLVLCLPLQLRHVTDFRERLLKGDDLSTEIVSFIRYQRALHARVAAGNHAPAGDLFLELSDGFLQPGKA